MRTEGGLKGGRTIVKIDDKAGIMNNRRYLSVVASASFRERTAPTAAEHLSTIRTMTVALGRLLSRSMLPITKKAAFIKASAGITGQWNLPSLNCRTDGSG